MKPRFPLTGTDEGALGFGRRPQDDLLPDSAAGYEDRACCCPAHPVVRAVIPPTPERRHSVDLLLCGHHYRVSRQALAARRARIESLPGKADAAGAALLLEAVHRDHAEVR
jgi:hypothetical protein